MKLLVDNSLSPELAEELARQGHDAVHVRGCGLAHASDERIFERASLDLRVLVSADTDFASILATRGVAVPSLILFRHRAPRRPRVQTQLLLELLPRLKEALEEGCVATIEAARVRVRSLPFSRPG